VHPEGDPPPLSSVPSAEDVELRSRQAIDVPLLRFLGAELVDGHGRGHAVSVPLTDNAVNAIGAPHGGVIATLLETAAYLALAPQMSSEENAITHAFAASYLAAPESRADLLATGALLRRSRRLAFVFAELRSQEELLATATVTKSIVRGDRSESKS
jgi:uncharacterized protein (TIGR00369 family)